MSIYSLPTPGNDRGDASDSISPIESNLVPTLFGPSNKNAYTIFIQNSPGSLVDKHERTAYYIHNQINVKQALIDVDA